MNMIGMLLLSLGTPMMLAGDEFRNTQDGNNNAYCQDNDITWLKWDWMYSTNKTREMRRLKPCLDWWRCVNHWTCITTRISSPDGPRSAYSSPQAACSGSCPTVPRRWSVTGSIWAYVASPCDCCPTVRWTCALWSTAPLTTAHSACRQTLTGRLNGARPKSTAVEPGMALRSRNAI